MAVHGSDDQFGVGLLYVWLDIAEADFSDYYSVGVASGQIICRHRARLRVDDVIAIVLRSDIPRQFRMLCFAGSGLLLCARHELPPALLWLIRLHGERLRGLQGRCGSHSTSTGFLTLVRQPRA